MIAVVVADARGCPYCVGAHSQALRALGVPEATVFGLVTDLDATAIETDWRQILHFARAAANDVHRVTDAQVDGLRAIGLTDSDLVELAMVIALFTALSLMLDLLAVPVDEPPPTPAG